jgi:hypothetical protein
VLLLLFLLVQLQEVLCLAGALQQLLQACRLFPHLLQELQLAVPQVQQQLQECQALPQQQQEQRQVLHTGAQSEAAVNRLACIATLSDAKQKDKVTAEQVPLAKGNLKAAGSAAKQQQPSPPGVPVSSAAPPTQKQ